MRGSIAKTFLLAALGALFLGGCATVSRPRRSVLPMPEHTLVLGEVGYIASQDEVLKGLKLGSDDVPPPNAFVQQCNPDDNAVEDGVFVLVRYYYYWQNVPSGIVHQGARWAVVPSGLTVEPGNVVEVELSAGKTNPKFRCSTISRIRFEDLEAGQCEYRQDPHTTFDTTLTAVEPAGRPGAAALYCPHVEAEGWEQFFMGANGGSAWRKKPSIAPPVVE
jgi:hypothetical protein